MKSLTVPVIGMNFINSISKTAIQFELDGTLETVWANGNQTSSNALLVNLVVNEVGDKFVATNDSKTMGADGTTPLFKKGETVTRLKQTVEFKSFTGDNSATQFAQGAKAFGLQLVVQMG